MIGKYHVFMKSTKISYSFTVERKYTILCGDSGSGKTYITELINNLDVIEFTSEVNIEVLSYKRRNYENELKTISNEIFVVDEDNPIMKDNDDIELMHKSDNYFIIICRLNSSKIPYSILEMYHVKNKGLVNYYLRIYKDFHANIKPELIITEDEKSGYQFFKAITEKTQIKCIGAGGNAKVFHLLLSVIDKFDKIVIIVDGSAFGAFIDDIYEIKTTFLNKQIEIFAPESFEYLLLNTNAVNADMDILERTYNYHDIQHVRKLIDDENYNEDIISWERVYTAYMTGLTKYTSHQYSKGDLNDYYLRYTREVMKQLTGLIIE